MYVQSLLDRNEKEVAQRSFHPVWLGAQSNLLEVSWLQLLLQMCPYSAQQYGWSVCQSSQYNGNPVSYFRHVGPKTESEILNPK